MVAAIDTMQDRAWTTETFLAWEDRQEFKYEFDGERVIPIAGGSIAHQRVVLNLCIALMGVLDSTTLMVLLEMRLRIGRKIRYPDVVVCARPLDQRTRTLTDALVLFEVLSDDTAVIDRVNKLVDYAAVPSVRGYVLLEQTAVAATLFQRAPGSEWIASAHTSGLLTLPGLDLALPLVDLYRGLTFAA